MPVLTISWSLRNAHRAFDQIYWVGMVLEAAKKFSFPLGMSRRLFMPPEGAMWVTLLRAVYRQSELPSERAYYPYSTLHGRHLPRPTGIRS